MEAMCLGGASRHAPGASTWIGETGRSLTSNRQGCRRLATQSKPHDKPLVDSFKAEENSNLPLQRDGLTATADTLSNSPPNCMRRGTGFVMWRRCIACAMGNIRH
jgi:hypothetical protein